MDIFWKNKNWEDSDKHLVKLKEMPFKRPFPFIPEANGLYIVRGPRQVGKSSWLKEVLSHYAEKRKCFYLSCEQLESYRELGALLESLRDYEVVLLDEISFVKDWARAVKHAVDSGYTKILMITGSHAFDLKKGSDLMPGRFEGGGDYELLPMGFDEFALMRKQAGWALESRLEECRAFFRVGGFPAAVAEGGPTAKLPTNSLKTYWKWLLGDVLKLGKDQLFLTELLIAIGKFIQEPISLQSLTKNTSIGSHNTVQEYLSLLESCFAIRTLYSVDIDSGTFHTKRNRKIYFLDPLLYWLSLDLSGESVSDSAEGKIAELAAHETLARKYSRFGYFRSKNGEIDFVKPRKWAIEVKWSPIAYNLSKAYYSQQFPFKVVWTQESFFSDMPPAESSILSNKK
ncbi:MAG: ATP-binding protein [Deltaproteobacteria bacterium]|nr:ATP-binding protein [Deltaproteobacteria bacterium]